MQSQVADPAGNERVLLLKLFDNLASDLFLQFLPAQDCTGLFRSSTVVTLGDECCRPGWVVQFGKLFKRLMTVCGVTVVACDTGRLAAEMDTLN